MAKDAYLMYSTKATCRNCGTSLSPQHTGRPGEYCDTKCRQAAHRRKRQRKPSETIPVDRELLHFVRWLEDEANDLRTALQQSADGIEPLTKLAQLQQRIDQVTPVAVAHARRRGVSWTAIGSAVNLHKDTVRHKYGRKNALPPSMPQPSRLSASASDGFSDEDLHEEREGPHGTEQRSNQLAPVLSHLQRASGMTLRTLGERTCISASHLSRILSGERFPDWGLTSRIARACGADASVLWKVWDDARTYRTFERRTKPLLHPSLLHLHQRAGSPSAAVLAVASGGRLNPSKIEATLDGTAVPEWETVEHLVLLLDGVPSYFHPLWEASCEQVPTPPASPDSPLEPHHETLETLMAAFNTAFAPPPRTAGRLPAPRTYLPAPIPALTRWHATPAADGPDDTTQDTVDDMPTS